MNTPNPPPALKALLEALDRATDPEARQRAWNALVEYQRQQEVRAQPHQEPPRG